MHRNNANDNHGHTKYGTEVNQMTGTENQVHKNEMSIRELPDSLELKLGTPSKGVAITLKCYTDFSKAKGEENEVQEKVDGLLKIYEYLKGKGFN